MLNFTTVSLNRHPDLRRYENMKMKYITIEREYGSGGTQIARRLAEETGIPCYGREILEAVSAAQNLSVNDIEQYEEKVTGSFLYTFYAMAQASSGKTDMLTKEGYLFVAEQAEIKKLAANGKSIFLGHCASEALKEEEGVVKVFIRCSDEDEKRKRITQEYGIPEYDAEKIRKRFDKKRANYFYANTTKKWDDYNNYDLVLNSAALGMDGCVAVLKGLLG